MILYRTYDEPIDGSKRLRVRYFVEGPNGKMLVFAEVRYTYIRIYYA